jgi:hypothetical protein
MGSDLMTQRVKGALTLARASEPSLGHASEPSFVAVLSRSEPAGAPLIAHSLLKKFGLAPMRPDERRDRVGDALHVQLQQMNEPQSERDDAVRSAIDPATTSQGIIDRLRRIVVLHARDA